MRVIDAPFLFQRCLCSQTHKIILCKPTYRERECGFLKEMTPAGAGVSITLIPRPKRCKDCVLLEQTMTDSFADSDSEDVKKVMVATARNKVVGRAIKG